MKILKNNSLELLEYTGNVSALRVLVACRAESVNTPVVVPDYRKIQVDLAVDGRKVFVGNFQDFFQIFWLANCEASERYYALKNVAKMLDVVPVGAATYNERRSDLTVVFPTALSGKVTCEFRCDDFLNSANDATSSITVAYDIGNEPALYDFTVDKYPVQKSETLSNRYNGIVSTIVLIDSDASSVVKSFLNNVTISSEFSEGTYQGDELASRQALPYDLTRTTQALILTDRDEFLSNPSVNLSLNVSLMSASSYTLAAVKVSQRSSVSRRNLRYEAISEFLRN